MAGGATSQMFLDDEVQAHGDYSNPYVDFFRDSLGRGPGRYYTHIGEVFSATPKYQRGYGYLGSKDRYSFRHGRGIGSTLMSMFRMAMPLLKRGAQKLGTEAVDFASKVASDAIQGQNIKESAIKHATEKASNIMKDLPGTFSGLIDKTVSPAPIPVSPIPEPKPSIVIPRKRKLPPRNKFRKFGRGIANPLKHLEKKYPALALMS
jgi:hypothetical protein